MILNANIPLGTQKPTRQFPWRVGLFLGVSMVGILLGWTASKKIVLGITIPTLETPSGISLRLTSKNTQWLATHTRGLAINDTCPIDLPTLIAYKQPSWIIIGDTGEHATITAKGKLPLELKNYKTAFGCNINSTKNNYTFQNETPSLKKKLSFTSPDGVAWKNDLTASVLLVNEGLSIKFPNITPQEPTWIPKQNLLAALPLEKTSFENLPLVWQGLHDLFASNQGIAFFSWKTEDNEAAIALTTKGDASDEIILSILYDIAKIPTYTEKQFREDKNSYITTKKEELSLTWTDETHAEIHTANGTVVGYATKQDTTTRISTATTEWIMESPQWEAPLKNNSSTQAHQTRTLANFGIRIVVTNKNIIIINK